MLSWRKEKINTSRQHFNNNLPRLYYYSITTSKLKTWGKEEEQNLAKETGTKCV